MWFLIAFFWLFLSGVVASYASKRGRCGVCWLIFSLVFTPFIGIIFVAASPDLKLKAEKQEQEAQRREEWENAKTCPNCAESVKKAATVCRFCGFNFAEKISSETASAKALGLPSTDKWYDDDITTTPPELSKSTSKIASILKWVGGAAIGLAVLIFVIGLIGNMLSNRDGGGGQFFYPVRSDPGFDTEISRTLARSGIRGCGEYTYRKAGTGEYDVACWSASGTPTYYIVWTVINDVMGPYYK